MARSKEEIAALTETLKAAYARGMTLKQIERTYDVAASHAGRLLKRAGVQLRQSADLTPLRREGWGGLNGTQKQLYRDRLRGKKY